MLNDGFGRRGLSMSKVYLITGASRGMGVELARAALAAGHSVVATGRDPEAVTSAVGAHECLLPVPLDITNPVQVEQATSLAAKRFGRIDVLINNAGNFYGGFFEELSSKQVREQIETNFFGTLNVTRAVLPLMRQQLGGLVVTITSLVGLIGKEGMSAYAASKFALEGWMEAITPELNPFGIRTMLVEPGLFRTELLQPESTTYAELSLADYAERAEKVAGWEALNGRQAGDPVKLANALIHLADSADPPLRWVAGADAVATVEHKVQTLLSQLAAHRALSTSLAYQDT